MQGGAPQCMLEKWSGIESYAQSMVWGRSWSLVCHWAWDYVYMYISIYVFILSMTMATPKMREGASR